MVSLREVKDIDTLMSWRAEVIGHVFGVQPTQTMLAANRLYYENHIADGTHVAFVVSYGGVECGCGAVCFTDELPSPDNPTGRCAYLMNIYVREPFRKHGIAHYVVSHLIEAAKSRDCGKIYLETTVDGKSVYSSLGFKDMPDMMKYYE